MATKQKTGGMNEPQKADDEVQGYVDQVKSSVEEAIGRKVEKFEAKLYASQLVNGINYFVKVDTGDGKFVHVRLHKTFQGEVTFNSCQDGKTETEELKYF
ncbi:cystatin-A2-like [Patiria miniata]|uniref:Cystatin domain-containing protein n=1 Tax=Patiria miniata TaxID=46514 RepID=A0A913ZEB0_PATMI|nr:cystatin-A2-like [Patiria miniata]XP_038049286.1 cystatin-A2-like [Patiria miniata]